MNLKIICKPRRSTISYHGNKATLPMSEAKSIEQLPSLALNINFITRSFVRQTAQMARAAARWRRSLKVMNKARIVRYENLLQW